MPQVKEVDSKYGRLSVLKELKGGHFPSGLSYREVEVKCDCGTVKKVKVHHLRSGRTVSCGCHKREKATDHGLFGTDIYNSWRSMIDRCSPRAKAAKYYYERGITVCERWKDLKNFAEDMGEKPSSKHELDRIDNDQGYSPKNCRWATRSVQNINKRTLKKRAHTLPKNVYKRKDKFFGRVGKDYLGLFATTEEASSAVANYLKSNGI